MVIRNNIQGRLIRYDVTTEHGVTQTIYAESMKQARETMTVALPGVKLKRLREL